MGTNWGGIMSFTNPQSFPHKIRGFMRKNIELYAFQVFGNPWAKCLNFFNTGGSVFKSGG